MRIALGSVPIAALAMLSAAGGCGPKKDLHVADTMHKVVEGDGLSVAIKLPRRDLTVGEKLHVSVTATNTSDKPITIHAPTGAPVLVRVLRRTLLGEEEVKYYPRSATGNILSWTLPPGVSRPFTLIIPVEPDWPAEEVLYVSAELNGHPEIAPALFVTVKMSEQAKSLQ